MTTSPVGSANAEAMPANRRAFIAALAAAGAIGLGASARSALAGEPGPIESAYPEQVQLAKVRDAASEAVGEAEDRYIEPQRLPFRMGMEGRYAVYRVGKQNVCFVDDGDENIAELKALIATNPFTPGSIDFEYHAIRAKRAEKLLADIEAWKSEAQRRAEAAGLPQAKEIERKAKAAAQQHAATIFAMEPTTYRELAFLAAALTCTWDREVANKIPDQLMKLAGIPFYWLDDAKPTFSDRRAA